MNVLGIESSCDETAIALLFGEGDSLEVRSSVVLSQIQEHTKYGGVVPEVAARKHLEAIFPMLEEEVAHDGSGVDVIAVTAGPGLAPALRTGVEVAKTLSWAWNKPLVPVSHLEGHLYAAWLTDERRVPAFPALCLLVSGGHTELIVMRGHGQFERIGETLDDAAGEAFDKVAKMLGLGYPGGPLIAKAAVQGSIDAFDFPRGLLDRQNVHFSFSGLKTSVLYTLRKHEHRLKEPAFIADVSASFQEAVVDVLTKKTKRALQEVQPASLIVAGGVAANLELRARMETLAQKHKVAFFVPPFAYTMDNAAMIAAAGYFRAKHGERTDLPFAVKADPNLDVSLV